MSLLPLWGLGAMVVPGSLGQFWSAMVPIGL